MSVVWFSLVEKYAKCLQHNDTIKCFLLSAFSRLRKKSDTNIYAIFKWPMSIYKIGCLFLPINMNLLCDVTKFHSIESHTSHFGNHWWDDDDEGRIKWFFLLIDIKWRDYKRRRLLKFHCNRRLFWVWWREFFEASGVSQANVVI